MSRRRKRSDPTVLADYRGWQDALGPFQEWLNTRLRCTRNVTVVIDIGLNMPPIAFVSYGDPPEITNDAGDAVFIYPEDTREGDRIRG